MPAFQVAVGPPFAAQVEVLPTRAIRKGDGSGGGIAAWRGAEVARGGAGDILVLIEVTGRQFPIPRSATLRFHGQAVHVVLGFGVTDARCGNGVVLAVDSHIAVDAGGRAGAVNRVAGRIPQVAFDQLVGGVLPDVQGIGGAHRWREVVCQLDRAIVLHGMVHAGCGGVDSRTVGDIAVEMRAGDHRELSRPGGCSRLGRGGGEIGGMAVVVEPIDAQAERPVAGLVAEGRRAMQSGKVLVRSVELEVLAEGIQLGVRFESGRHVRTHQHHAAHRIAGI